MKLVCTHMMPFERCPLNRSPSDNHRWEMQARCLSSAYQQDRACTQQTLRPQQSTIPPGIHHSLLHDQDQHKICQQDRDWVQWLWGLQLTELQLYELQW